MDYSITPNFRPSIQAGLKLPVRSAYIQYLKEVDGAESKSVEDVVSLNGLNVRFQVDVNMGDIYPRAQIDICNANRETREFLTNYFYYRDPDKSSHIIRLYAGYIEPGKTWRDTPYIFSGNVLFTTITKPPDVWTCIQSIYDRSKSGLSVQEWGIKGTVSTSQMLAAAASRLGLELSMSSTPPGSITGFVASGDGNELLRRLRWYVPGYLVYIRDDKLVVEKKNRDVPAPGETVWEIRADTGMVEIPQFNALGASVTVLLNPVMRPGDWINLSSIHQPSGSGMFRILKIRHRGELRGDPFFSELETFRPLEKA